MNSWAVDIFQRALRVPREVGGDGKCSRRNNGRRSLQTPFSPALQDTENAIARIAAILTLQRQVIAATERDGRDADQDRTLLIIMEREHAELEEGRWQLLS
jgi:hypothetical protein